MSSRRCFEYAALTVVIAAVRVIQEKESEVIIQKESATRYPARAKEVEGIQGGERAEDGTSDSDSGVKERRKQDLR